MKHLLTLKFSIFFAVGAVYPVTVQAEQSKILCTYRSDRPDLGSPVYSKKGGRSLRHRIPNGHGVTILKTSGTWHHIRYADPGPPVRSEPLRFTGWISGRYLKECTLSPEEGRAVNVEEAAKAMDGDSDTEVRSSSREAPPIKICWWNVKRLGHGTRDWSASARTVKGCDVLGLREVMTRDAPVKLAAAMGADYRVTTSKRPRGTKSYREYYAVLFDSRRVKTVTRAIKGVPASYPDPRDKIAREPWSVALKAGNFDFRLVLFHATWSDSVAERIAELKQVDDIYRWYQERDPREQDIIIAGDFNRTPTQDGWDQVRSLGLKLLVSGQGSTIDTKGRLANLYDQIIVDPRHTKEWTGKSGVVTELGMKLMEFREKVSDHLPVWAGFGTSGVDDD